MESPMWSERSERDQIYFRQAGINILSRVQKWITYWMHSPESQKEGLMLLASSTAIVQCQNSLIIDIFAAGIKDKKLPCPVCDKEHWPYCPANSRETRWTEHILNKK